jgi:hypothetical protein
VINPVFKEDLKVVEVAECVEDEVEEAQAVEVVFQLASI